MRGDQLSRQWRVLRHIETSRIGLTAGEIAARTGIPLRTAYRDLADLEKSGFPLYTEKDGRVQRWKLVESYTLGLSQPFTLTELLSLQLSRDLFQVFAGTVFHESADSLFEKITAALPPESISFLERVRSAYHVTSRPCKDYGRFRELLGRVHQAVLERRSLEIAYLGLSDEAAVLRKINPYKIWFSEGTLYVIAHCRLRNEIRTFVLDRIQVLRLTDEIFAVSPDFSFEDFIRHSFKVMQQDLHTVVIQISPAWARYVGERIWHESQTIQKLFDGGIELALRVAGLEEIRQWILGLGPEAYVVAPEELKALVKADLKAALAQYEPVGGRIGPDGANGVNRQYLESKK